jgi:hypothetical protein
MTVCKSALTPFLLGVKLEDGGESPLVDITLYIKLMGSLLYLTHSIPDLSYAIGIVSRFMQEPHELHWKVAKHILRYIQRNTTFGIHYALESTLYLIGFTNSYLASDNTDHKSTSGYSLSLGFGPIWWSSKKQVAIDLSSFEEEYRGVVNITIQDMCLQYFLIDLGIHFHRPIDIWCDNQRTMKFCRDLVQRQQTKPIKIHIHYIWDLVHEGIIDL